MQKRDNACTDETDEGRRRKCSEDGNSNDDDDDDDDGNAEMVVACNWPTETALNMPQAAASAAAAAALSSSCKHKMECMKDRKRTCWCIIARILRSNQER
jgi:hypothetical protein